MFIETTIYIDCSINCVNDLCISKMFGLQQVEVIGELSTSTLNISTIR